jgi:hypothetical protein
MSDDEVKLDLGIGIRDSDPYEGYKLHVVKGEKGIEDINENYEYLVDSVKVIHTRGCHRFKVLFWGRRKDEKK